MVDSIDSIVFANEGESSVLTSNRAGLDIIVDTVNVRPIDDAVYCSGWRSAPVGLSYGRFADFSAC